MWTDVGRSRGQIAVGDDEELVEEDLVWYRSVVATANFIAPDVRFAVKERYKEMARPAGES